MELHPELVKKKGKVEFVVLPYKEFLAIQERLEDAEDLLELRRAKKKDAGKPSVTLADVKKRF